MGKKEEKKREGGVNKKQTKPPKQETPKKQFLKPSKKTLLLIAIALIFLILIDTFITGIGKFAYNTVRCGRVPVETIPKGIFIVPDTRSGYILPGDNGYRLGIGNDYYCTQEEAEVKGIRVDPLTKEGLRQDAERTR